MQDLDLLRQQQLIEAQPGSAEARVELARLLMERGRLAEAVLQMRAAIGLGPANLAACYNNLGVIQYHLQEWDGAAESFRHAIAITPGDALAHNNLGDTLRQMGQVEAAELSYRGAIRIAPRLGRPRASLGLMLYLAGRFREAIEQLRVAVQLEPRDSASQSNLFLCHTRLSEHGLALEAARRAVEIEPENAEVHSNLIAFMNYVTWDDPAAVLKESREWDRRHGKKYAMPAPVHSRDPERKLRIGFISPDFKDHPVAFFLQPVLEHRDRERFSVACYADVSKPDAMTERMRASVDVWRSIAGAGHADVAAQIRADEIDILIDLCGHFVDNRLVVMAQHAAPVQVSWLGYPNTTGVSAIDYRLTDSFADPEGSADHFYSEKLVRLPKAFFVYRPPAEAPAASSLPMVERGHVTFGSFNNFTKITPAVADLWSEILRAIPRAKLLLAGLGGDRGEQARGMFGRRGIADERIEITGWMNFTDYLQTFSRVDISLDPFPWAGHTTTCHSLWMGAPVISLAGAAALSRAGVSVMGNLEMESQWVAASRDEYLSIARRWADKPMELAAVRAGLRGRMQASPLMDEVGFTRSFEEALRGMWRKSCGL